MPRPSPSKFGRDLRWMWIFTIQYGQHLFTGGHIFFGKNIDELVQIVNFGSHYYNDRDVDVKLLSGR